MIYWHVDYNEVIDILGKNQNNESLKDINVFVLRNITLEPIFDTYLKYYFCKLGYMPSIKYGELSDIFQEVATCKGLLNDSTDIVVVFIQLETLSRSITSTYLYTNNIEIEKEKNNITNYVEAIFNFIRKQTQAIILFVSFELPVYPLYGILDSQSETYQMGTINWLNNQLKHIIYKNANAYYIDINLCISRVGSKNFYDRRLWYATRTPYSKDAFQEISFEISKYVRTIYGINKKCIVLDCDNVLWGGVIGEDGLSGIILGPDYEGLAYYEFQQEIVNLYDRGVIIAICSKNNENDIWEVFNNHPYMILKRHHISASRINWDDKTNNIISISKELNISLESLVFVDDSEYEIELVNSILPQVETVHLQKNKYFTYRDIIVSCGLFDSLNLTEEDKNRGVMYKLQIERNKLAKEVSDIDTFIKSLEIEIEVYVSNSFYIPRIAQLTQRTNQFNLTTKRYTQNDIKMFIESDNYDVLSVKLVDRFGDYGIIGTAILAYDKFKAYIDTFLISCRALGRRVEDVLLAECIKMAKFKGKKEIYGIYYPTNKNVHVKDFYKSKGFITLQNGEHYIGKYNIDFSHSYVLPECYKSITSEIDLLNTIEE
jgi:FkbH-like protein